MTSTKLNDNLRQLHGQSRVAEYFSIVSLPPQLTSTIKSHEINPNRDETTDLKVEIEHDKLLYPNLELENSSLKQQSDRSDPIVELAILNKTLSETVPIGYECLWLTPDGNSANLVGASLFKSNEMFLCYKRGRNKPPITDIGVLYENKEVVMEGCIDIRETVGKNSANLNNSSLNTDRVYITYRRGSELACNSLAVIDLCVINKSKGEIAPHSFNEIQKNLNKSLLGSSIYICYKKAWISAPQVKYTPSVVYRFPEKDHSDLPFPKEIAMFGLPMGAVIESWPNSTNLENLKKPVFSTFVLNITSDDGIVLNEKVYGSSLTFYEEIEHPSINTKINNILGFDQEQDTKKGASLSRTLYANKSLILLSRNPFFKSFKKFLLFLFNYYSQKEKLHEKGFVPIERYLYYLIYEIPYPTQQKPRVLINLTEKDEDCLSINMPNECQLPQSGASFIDLLKNLGVENSINVFLFVLMQRNVMVHSLRRGVLTGVVEAISCIIFPFIWRYSYIPMCPLNLYQLVDAPGSFILGMDTRFFDIYPYQPSTVICVDLDTNTISWTIDRKNINLKIMPKKSLNELQNNLTKISYELEKVNEMEQQLNSSLQGRFFSTSSDIEGKLRKRKLMLNTLIREAFLKFMVSILHNYKKFLKTVTRKPNLKALDRNLNTYFDSEGFIRHMEKENQPCNLFFKELVKTQLFYECIMNLSFTTELQLELADSFAFFSDLCSRYNYTSTEIRLLDLNESLNNQTVVILPPALNEIFNGQTDGHLNSDFIYDINAGKFPISKAELHQNSLAIKNSLNNLEYDKEGTMNSKTELDQENEDSVDLQPSKQLENIRSLKIIPNTPIGVRTQTEKLQYKKTICLVLQKAEHHNKNTKKITSLSKINSKVQAFYFLSQAYSLWFIYLPEYVKTCTCKDTIKSLLNYGYYVLIQMQNHHLTQPDEICFRIMMQLCLMYKFPTLAVKTLLHMRKFKIELTPITYSFYNKALIDVESWPTFQQDRWAKVRAIFLVISQFKHNLKLKAYREKSKLKKHRKRSSSKYKNEKTANKTHNKSLDCSESNTQISQSMTDSLNNQKTVKTKVENKLDRAINDERLLKSKHNCLVIDRIGIIMLSNELDYKKTIINKRLHSIHEIDLINKASINISSFKKAITTEKNFKSLFSTPITKNDPLNAFSNYNENLNNEKENENNKKLDVKKKLFAEPFCQSQENLKIFHLEKIPQVQQIDTDSDNQSDYYETDETEEENDDEDYESDESEVEKQSVSNYSFDEKSEITTENEQTEKYLTPVKGQKSTNFFNTPSNTVASFIENSSSKIKVFGRFLTEKSQELKQATRNSSQQPQIESITNRIKSLSGYHLSAPQFLSDLVKSNSSYSNGASSDDSNKNYKAFSEKKMNDQNDLKNVQDDHSYLEIDLDPLTSLDEHFIPIKADWWNKEFNSFFYEKEHSRNSLDSNSIKSVSDANLDDFDINIKITSCNVCEKCKKFLYDEDVMSGWTLNESDLNSKCTNCYKTLVPKLFIKIKDHKCIQNFLRNLRDKLTNTSIIEDPLTLNDEATPEKSDNVHKEIETEEFTIEYLSPLVVRKELENILTIKSENERDSSASTIINASFINEHAVVFWNLLWYFKRIGVDYRQLTIDILNNRINVFRNRQKSNEMLAFNEIKPGDLVRENKNDVRYPKVLISCMWDNLKLHQAYVSYEVPLYISHIKSKLDKEIQKNSNMSKKRIGTFNDVEEIFSFRISSTAPRSLERISEHIIRQIKESSELFTPIKMLLKERLVSRINYSSIYREILFLILVALEREHIDLDSFDSEYRNSFKNLLKQSKFQTNDSILASDRPPNNLAVWCRRLFSPLNL